MQVADRFHLLQNLTQALEQALGNQTTVLKTVDTAQRLADAPEGATVMYYCCHARTARCSTTCRTKASATPQSLRKDLAIARRRLVY